jgi:hypothetical protein
MPERNVQFLTECHADTALIRFLFPNHRMSIHEQGCPEVAKSMLSPRANEYELIGIVDNDKKLNIHCKGFFAGFEQILYTDKVFLKRHPITHQHLVVIDKAIDSFIWWNANEVDIDIKHYEFDSSSIKRFAMQLKTPIIETSSNYSQLLTDLYLSQAPGILTLERILNDIITI